MILIDADKVSQSRPGKALFTDLSVTLATGDRVGVVGLNGCGKSTLVRVLLGETEPESGVVRRGRDVRIAHLPQRPDLGTGTVREAVAAAKGAAAWEGESVLDRLGMGAKLDADVALLSGGEAKRVALARTLVTECDLLVLDEPTNHLDIDGIAWLEERLARFSGGLLVVTHDRHLLDSVTTKVLEIDRGTGYLHDGGYATYLEGRAAREDAAESAESVRKNLAKRELEWLRRGAPARTAKSKARIRSATALVEGGPQAAARQGDLNWHVDTPRLGDQVIELEKVSFRHATAPADSPDLLRNVTLDIGPRERLGIVGVNGTGKSTLLDILAGRLAPTEGKITTGPTVSLAYYDQVGRELDPQQRVRHVVTPGGGEPDWRDARLLERFWFDSDTQFAPIELLSGGERRRLQLVITLAQQPNVLFLDEPTNDLDLDTLRSLEDFLEDFPGAVIVVSHDRAFLERTVDDVVVLDGSGRVGRVPGGYESWENERRAQRGKKQKPGKTAKVANSSVASPGPAAGPAPSKSTLRQRIKDAEKAIRPLDKKRTSLNEALVDAGVDHEKLTALGSELRDIESQLAELEEQWLELSEALEALG